MIWAILAANGLAFALLIWRGDRPEWFTVPCLAATIMAEPMAQTLTIATWPLGLVIVNGLLLVALLWLNERHDRWWIFCTATIQLLIVCTHIMPLMSADYLQRTLVTLRLGLWLLMSGLFFLGVLEAWAARRFRLEDGYSNGYDSHDHRGL